ncbi:MAG: hypothetical protein MJ025_00465 [Victivallaceae bacterium]|nr:hypothetical protein [Victivallaceae bacterium]
MGTFADSDSGRLFYHGDSMRRVFRDGDLLEWKGVPASSLRRGDVVAMAGRGRAGSNIVHRVIAVSPDGVSTQGDNNRTPDLWTTPLDEMVGLVVAAVDANGRKRLVRGGNRGRMSFVWHSFRRRFRLFFSAPANMLIGMMFWRRKLPAPVAVGGMMQYVVDGRLVAIGSANGEVRFINDFDRLKYRI